MVMLSSFSAINVFVTTSVPFLMQFQSGAVLSDQRSHTDNRRVEEMSCFYIMSLLYNCFWFQCLKDILLFS